MKVINTYIISWGHGLQPLFECEGNAWFSGIYSEDRVFTLVEIPESDAREAIQQKFALDFANTKLRK